MSTQITIVNVSGPAKESGNVFLEHGQCCVEVLENADHGVLAFDRVLGTFEGADRVEGPM